MDFRIIWHSCSPWRVVEPFETFVCASSFDNADYTTFYFGYLFSFTVRVTSYFYRSLWPIFHGPVILPCISNSINYEGIILWILVQSDTVSDLILFGGHYRDIRTILTLERRIRREGESTRGGVTLSLGEWLGASPEKILKFMTHVDAFWAIAGTFYSHFSIVNLSHLCAEDAY